jgi:hypothetical protein
MNKTLDKLETLLSDLETMAKAKHPDYHHAIQLGVLKGLLRTWVFHAEGLDDQLDQAIHTLPQIIK